jgi:type VI secretion system protein ImpK
MLGSSQSPAPWGGAGDPTRTVDSGSNPDFLGIRYALTCWLDEILIEAGWREWDENKLENSLYRTNIRYSNFWQQARLAEASPGASEAQEAFLLCVLLGFRGEMGESPEKLREWVQSTRHRVTRGLGKELPPLPEKAPVSDVPPLLGVEAYRKMTQRLVAGVLFAVPVTAFLVVILFR